MSVQNPMVSAISFLGRFGGRKKLSLACFINVQMREAVLTFY
jgi:hypothetical protein